MRTSALRWFAFSAVLHAVLQVAAAGRPQAQDSVLSGNSSYFHFNWYDGGIGTNRSHEYYSLAIQSDPAWAVPYNNRGLAQYRFRRFAAADADFDQAKTLDPSYLAPYINKSKSLAAQSRFDEALQELHVGASRAVPNAALYYNLGWIYDEKGQYAFAISNYTKALEANPAHNRARLARAITHAKNGDTQLAIDEFYKVISLTTNQDICRGLAAYNLHVLRSGGLSISNPAQAERFREGTFLLSTAQYGRALDQLALASAYSNRYPEIAIVSAWACPDRLWSRRIMGEASDLFHHTFLYISAPAGDVFRTNAEVYVDGLHRGKFHNSSLPAKLTYVFSEGDLVVRHRGVKGPREWHGILAHDDPPGSTNALLVSLRSVSEHTPFRAMFDRNRNGIDDTWESSFSGGLGMDPEADDDGDGLSNLAEYYANGNPYNADADGDGSSDAAETIARTDPADPGSRFAMERVWRDPTFGVILPYRMPESTTFTVEHCTSLMNDTWVEVPSPRYSVRYSAGESGYEIMAELPGDAFRYYRLRLVGNLETGEHAFVSQDIANLGTFVAQLREHTNAARALVWTHLSAVNRERVAKFSAAQDDALLRSALVRELDRWVQGSSLYERSEFRTVSLSSKSLSLLSSYVVVRPLNLNRSILVDVFPGGLKYR